MYSSVNGLIEDGLKGLEHAGGASTSAISCTEHWTLWSLFFYDYLFGREYWDVVLIYKSGFLFNNIWIGFLFELFTCKPEENIFLTVLTAQKVSKHFPAS